VCELCRFQNARYNDKNYTRSNQTRGIFLLAGELLASQEGLCSTELVSSKPFISSLHDPHRQRHTSTKILFHFLHFSLQTSEVHCPYLTVQRTVADTVSVKSQTLHKRR